MEQLIFTASRIAQQRTEAPVAIGIISSQTLQEAKPNRLDQVINKVSGVYMVNLANEQHEMSIRLPMTTKSLFLYLEDGIPIRTTGLYNHNALLEMNMSAAKQIEIIKGPASSLYGAEAVGGAVNIITVAPPPSLEASLGIQANNNGYKRMDMQAGNRFGNWGAVANGYHASRHDGPVSHSDFHKTAFTVRTEYKAGANTLWTNSITYADYYSDMAGALDSLRYAKKDYSSPYTFTYRKTNALRVRSQLSHKWNSNGNTQFFLVYRDNSIKQNPSYYIYKDARDTALAHGQVNDNSFNSYVFLGQHQQKFRWLGGRLIAGISADASPGTYKADYIRIKRDANGNYVGYSSTDSSLSNYSIGITNIASYAQFDCMPFTGFRVVAAMRYDHYYYRFANHLPSSAASGAPSSTNIFTRVTPKAGITYNYKRLGLYANYSQGFVPPQVTELYTNVNVPYLKPQTFFNYEAGGWLSFPNTGLYADWSIYLLDGTSEIMSILQDNGTYQNQNAGKTRHKGIEYGLTWKPGAAWTMRISATQAEHRFVQDVENGKDYSGNEMSGAPHTIVNGEITYRPSFAPGLRLGAEWQHQGNYWMNNANTRKYNGSDVLNIRAGYSRGGMEIWVNAFNVANAYYAVLALWSRYGYSYNMGDPRELNIGVSYHFIKSR